MNKIIKGSIAGAAGIALLLGGAGTFALWNDSTSVQGGKIKAGNLALVNQTGAWTECAHRRGHRRRTARELQDRSGQPAQYTGSVDVVAEGVDLEAELKAEPVEHHQYRSRTPSSNLDASSNSPVVSEIDDTNVFEVVPANGATTTPVAFTITVTFNPDSTTGKTGKVDLGEIGLTLQQTTNGNLVAPTP